MSGHQRSRRPGSPPASSSPAAVGSTRGCGPLRATKTFGPGSPSDPSSPSSPLTHGSGLSYDPGKRRSASSSVWTEKLISSNYSGFAKEKKLILSPVETIRRSASFDTIASSYLCGEWPRSRRPLIHLNLVHCPIVLTTDKWTQTVDDLEVQEVNAPVRQTLYQRYSDPSCVNCVYASSSSCGFREIRPARPCHSARVSPLACSGGGSPVAAGSDPTANTLGSHGGGLPSSSSSSVVPRSRAITIPVINRRNPLAPCQGSAEGFNQEIEKLVHNTGASESFFDLSKTQARTPDGHRAPIADLLNFRSVNTQTPSGGPFHSGIERHFLRILEDSDDSPSLPIIPGAGETSLLFNRPTSTESDKSDQCERVIGESVMSSSFIPLNTSEKRETPEGCDKTEVEFTKSSETPVKSDIFYELPRPMEASSILKCLIPSERSAFCPLLKKYVSQQTLRSFSLSANENDSSIEAK